MKITKRERDVMRLLVNGLTNKQIGQLLGISNYTVRDHISSAFKKLNVTSRVELAVIAAEMKDEK
ncbi:response regulator transcription factor [Pseudomonas sp. GL-RE-26]|uniref:response regulator transcription factor n=1 Tax=Pseudomonas sp. GL-RE-26 TaxID=2832390 RepID=UPI001CBD8EEF|nr:LuxR C-terminal-related transcriptional regulator [Pseudomonas sp. GL-RE-26]